MTDTLECAPPFDDSRRLTGYNFWFDSTGAVLEAGTAAHAPEVIAAWRARVAQARAALGWSDGPLVVREHDGGTTLALAASLDQLYTATEVNEWALCAALCDCGFETGTWPEQPDYLHAREETAALAILAAHARAERVPELLALAGEAGRRGIRVLADDEQLTLGSGRGGRSWPRTALPAVADVDWGALSDVPAALITGSNGKTTTTRLLAALARAQGWRTAHSCTDGVYVNDELIEAGDYSGPAGARLALRQADIEAAVLETARGGILRRGLALRRAEVAVVTNISDDHFGEYGIDDLDALAEVKLTVARPLGTQGTLVLNDDDALLLRHAANARARLALFAFDADAPALREQRARGGATAGLRRGRLILEHGDTRLDLGAIEAMPLSFGGAARYNVANIAAAALAGYALGIGAGTLRRVLASFGRARGDNPGRLEHCVLGGIEVFVDYAHNPDGLHGLLAVARRAQPGRMGLLLGQAGNRGEHEIRTLAGIAFAAHPDYVVLKDLPGYLRGRADGEVPAILRDELRQRGLPDTAIATVLDEWAAVRQLFGWARRGDILVLPVHGKENRPRVLAWLEELSRGGWQAGTALPSGPA